MLISSLLIRCLSTIENFSALLNLLNLTRLKGPIPCKSSPDNVPYTLSIISFDLSSSNLWGKGISFIFLASLILLVMIISLPFMFEYKLAIYFSPLPLLFSLSALFSSSLILSLISAAFSYSSLSIDVLSSSFNLSISLLTLSNPPVLFGTLPVC